MVLFCLTFILFSQENQLSTKEISGKITYLNTPLANVNIIIKGTKKGTKTNTKGDYTIQAKIGDIIQYSYVGFKTVSIIIEDVTSTLNIEMATMISELDEVVVTAKGDKYDMTETEKLRGKEFKTAIGMFHPGSIASKVIYFDEKDNLGRYFSFTDAWKTLYANTGRGLPRIWDVDGAIHYSEPYIDLSQIFDIHVIRSSIGTMKWGGPVIIVRTKYNNSEFREARIKDSTAKYTNKNYYNNDAVNANNETVFSNALRNKNKSINGKITYLNAPLANVNIIIKGTSKGTKTNTKGDYIIQAKIGDIIQYSYVGFNTVSIVVEDITEILNIEMKDNVNNLEEIVVTARKKPNKVSELEKRQDVELQTPFGTLNPKTTGFAINHLPGEKINDGGTSLVYALAGKFAGLNLAGIYPNEVLMIRNEQAVYVIDGMTFTGQPLIPLSTIRDIFILKHKAMVIIVTDNSPSTLKLKSEKNTEQYQNQNYYNDDAVTINNNTISSNTITNQYKYIITKNVIGKVTYLDAPLPNVNIIIAGKTIGTKTNTKGEYKIKANVGDIIQYSYLGFAKVSIIVEDVTEVLNIEMVLKVNELDEVTVTTDGKIGEVLERAKKADDAFETSRGKFNPKNAGYAVGFVDGNELVLLMATNSVTLIIL